MERRRFVEPMECGRRHRDLNSKHRHPAGYGFAISRRWAPEFYWERFAFFEKRARGTPDAPCVRSLMRKV
jgi:hypothetical protein